MAGGILSWDQAYTVLQAAVERNTDNVERSLNTIRDGLAHGQGRPFHLEDLEDERRAWIETHGTYRANGQRPQSDNFSTEEDSPPDKEPPPAIDAEATSRLFVSQRMSHGC